MRISPTRLSDDLRAGTGQDALDGRDDVVVDRGTGDLVGAVRQRRPGPGALAGRVLHRQVMREGEPELEHPQEDQQEDGHRHRVLDEALASAAVLDRSASGARARHWTGSMRIALPFVIR